MQKNCMEAVVDECCQELWHYVKQWKNTVALAETNLHSKSMPTDFWFVQVTANNFFSLGKEHKTCFPYKIFVF